MILLIGHGYWGKNIARTLGDKLYAVCDSDSEILKSVELLYPNSKIFSNIEDALEDNNITKVIIATKANSHFDISKLVIETGRHVWIEKPACISVEQIDELIYLSEKNNVKIFVDHIMCHDSTIKYLKENIKLDKPLLFESYRLHQGIFQPDVNVIYDLAIHDLSIIDYLFPNIKLLKKEIITNYQVKKEIADHAVLNLLFDNGLRATITCSWVSPVKQRQIFISNSDSVIHIYDGNIDVFKLKEEINENYQFNSIQSSKSIVVDQQLGLKTAIESFENMTDNLESTVTDIYQAKRIQQWIEL